MPTQTILSPGVQINEIDLSLRAVVPNGTNVLVLGFAQQGPIEEVFEIPDIQTFETIYGKPNNAAERYFYYSTRGVLDGGGRPIVSRLPYGDGTGAGSATDRYSCLAYPVMPVGNSLVAAQSVADLSDRDATYTFTAETSGYVIGAPTWIELTKTEYDRLAQNDIQWVDGSGTTPLTSVGYNSWFSSGFNDIASAGIIVLNKFQSTFEQKTFEGYVIGLSDSFDANPVSDFTSLQHIKYSPQDAPDPHVLPQDLYDIPEVRFNFPLTSTAVGGKNSLSQALETQGSNLELFQASFIDSISLGVYKLRQSLYTPEATTLDFTIPDGYTGSLNSYRKVQSTTGGPAVGYFLGDIEDNSTYVQVLVNPYISTVNGDWSNGNGLPNKYVVTYHSTSDFQTKFSSVTANKTYQNTNIYNNDPFTNWSTPGAWDPVVAELSSFGGFLERTLPVIDSAYSYGVTDINRGGTDLNNSAHAIGNVPGKIDRIFQTIDDVDALRIDLSVEAGLGSVYAQTNILGLSSYDDSIKFNIGSTSNSTGFYRTDGNLGDDNLTTNYQGGSKTGYNAQEVKDAYNSIYTQFETFARSIRKDHMFIADPLRPFFVEGANTKILANKSNTFVQHVYTPVKNLYDIVSTSYAAVYANWAKIVDLTDGQPKWIPFSGLLAGMMAADDANFAPWYAPAGFTRGKIPSPILDLAVSPSQRNRDSVYKIGVNPITKFPNDGITVFGQKTQLSTPSAFDRINVRRLFLYLEKITRSTMKYFVFEPNTVFTRTRVVNVLRPQFDIVKNNQGMYDYLIVCDERNNTPEVIDQNQLIVDIYIKPTRAAEFILVNFYATRTDQDFNELI